MSNLATVAAPETTISGLAELQAKQQELKDKQQLLKALKARQAWEAETKETEHDQG